MRPSRSLLVHVFLLTALRLAGLALLILLALLAAALLTPLLAALALLSALALAALALLTLLTALAALSGTVHVVISHMGKLRSMKGTTWLNGTAARSPMTGTPARSIRPAQAALHRR